MGSQLHSPRFDLGQSQEKNDALTRIDQLEAGLNCAYVRLVRGHGATASGRAHVGDTERVGARSVGILGGMNLENTIPILLDYLQRDDGGKAHIALASRYRDSQFDRKCPGPAVFV